MHCSGYSRKCVFLPLWEHSFPHKEFPTEGEAFCGMEEIRFGSQSQIYFSCRKKKKKTVLPPACGGDWKKRKGNREWVLTAPPFPTPRAYQCVQHARRAGKESIGGLLEEGLLRARQLLNSLLIQVHLLSSSWVTAFLSTKETRKPNLPQRQKASPAHTAHKEKSSLK